MMTYPQFRIFMRNRSKNFMASLDMTLEKERLALENIAKKNATTYPKIRTGNLYNSIRAAKQRKDNLILINLNAGGDSAPYAKYVEFGTRKMEPRAYLRRAFDKVDEGMEKSLSRFTRLYLARGGK